LPTAQILCRLRAAFGPFNQSGPTAAFSKLESASATGGYVNRARVIAARRFCGTRSPDPTRRCFLSFYYKGTIMIETFETGHPKLIGLKLGGKLHDAEYKQFVATMGTILTAEGKVRLFIQLEDFHGCDLHAAWDHITFSLKHYSNFERIAMVGDRKWAKWTTRLCKPFTHAKVRYFDRSAVDAAWNWLYEIVEGYMIMERAAQPLKVCEKTEFWNGCPWFGQ
jgi:hypothetical protein